MLYIIAVLIILFDQVTKHLAVTYLAGKSAPVIQNIFHLTYVENTGAAFGMFKNNNSFFIVISSVIIAVILYMIHKTKPMVKSAYISTGLIVGGAVGNIIDRIIRGYVVDFFDFRLINYPVFNIADCAVVIGAVLFAIGILRSEDVVDK